MSKLNANSIEFGSLTTSQRDALSGVANGTIIYNSTSSSFDGYGPNGWVQIKSITGLQASGGTTSEPGDGKRYHTFTAPGSFVVTQGSGTVTVQMVGGGGGGNSGNGQWAGGGGGGGYAYASRTISPGTYPVVRGTGAGRQSSCGSAGNSGGNSTIFGWTAYGGGGGSPGTQPGPAGGYNIPGGTDLGSGPGQAGNGLQGGDGTGWGGNNGRRNQDPSFTTWGGGAAGVPNYSPGPDASGYGNGGAGGHSCQNGHNGGGGGSPGIVVVSYPIV